MTDSLDCLRCHTPMEPGYILDRQYGGFTNEKWTPGEIHLHWWGVEQPKASLPVIAMRCPKCGMLESYARPNPAT